jgi:glucosamine-6-phosphate deaminase
VTVCADHGEMSLRAAERLVTAIGAVLAARGKALVTLSAGRTPEVLYEIIRTRYRQAIDWTRVTVAAMDDYLGLPGGSGFSCSAYLTERVIAPLGIRDFHPIPSGHDVTDEVLSAFEARLRGMGGLDIALHGIGQNGHVGFNEPGSGFTSGTRAVTLAESTRVANSGMFARAEVPRRGVTLGLALLGEARFSILLASGVAKQSAVRAALLGSVTEEVPATILRTCPSVVYFLDERAWAGGSE